MQLDADLLHMLLSCPTILSYWQRVLEVPLTKVEHVLMNSPKVVILGKFHRPMFKKPSTKFLDLALLAKYNITLHWKVSLPTIVSWTKVSLSWFQSESTLLHREE